MKTPEFSFKNPNIRKTVATLAAAMTGAVALSGCTEYLDSYPRDRTVNRICAWDGANFRDKPWVYKIDRTDSKIIGQVDLDGTPAHVNMKYCFNVADGVLVSSDNNGKWYGVSPNDLNKAIENRADTPRTIREIAEKVGKYTIFWVNQQRSDVERNS